MKKLCHNCEIGVSEEEAECPFCGGSLRGVPQAKPKAPSFYMVHHYVGNDAGGGKPVRSNKKKPGTISEIPEHDSTDIP